MNPAGGDGTAGPCGLGGRAFGQLAHGERDADRDRRDRGRGERGREQALSAFAPCGAGPDGARVQLVWRLGHRVVQHPGQAVTKVSHGVLFSANSSATAGSARNAARARAE